MFSRLKVINVQKMSTSSWLVLSNTSSRNINKILFIYILFYFIYVDILITTSLTNNLRIETFVFIKVKTNKQTQYIPNTTGMAKQFLG